MKLSTAPVFIHFPAKGKPKKGDTFEVHRHGFDAEVMVRFVAERTGGWHAGRVGVGVWEF